MLNANNLLNSSTDNRDYLMDDDNWRLTADENNNEIKSGGVLDFLGIF